MIKKSYFNLFFNVKYYYIIIMICEVYVSYFFGVNKTFSLSKVFFLAKE